MQEQELFGHLEQGGTIDEWMRAHPEAKLDEVVAVSAGRLAKLREHERDTLHTQLHELNERSRVYMTQVWQVPFAYIATVAVSSGTLLDKGAPREVAAAGLLVASVSGLVVLWHQQGAMDGSRRAVHNMRAVELALGLGTTSEYKAATVFLPLTILVALLVALSAAASLVVWLK